MRSSFSSTCRFRTFTLGTSSWASFLAQIFPRNAWNYF
uniref:Uncharacterized protein n=1 Tax=Rhizophora mucronata TaxID=61149 RepID=A0A2P2PIF1_RHIMU